ncbi:MAG: PQQ-like beta-propeller repeat protein, partial [Candidatus Omnitrophica bacterium]|nr:PQQ-like beta-propeller repeat protein [Candidatus Omnitrophota bacterium]
MKGIKSLLILAVLLGRNGHAADWPMWRADVLRSGSTLEALPEKLTLAWTRTLPPPMPAWPEDQTSLLFDTSYQPVCAGGLLLVPSNVTDSLTAYDVGTGEQRWSFHADGPVRFAPSVANGKVFLVSDDGYLYCLKLDSGELLWRFRGAPEERLGIGNHRLISLWPARGAPVVRDGVVYFTAGIWPFMGIFIHAVDAETGKSIWCNSGVGSTYITQPHSSPAFAGIAPQGYLVLSGDTLLVPGGRSVPAAYDSKTGEQRYFDANHGKGTGGYQVAAGDSWFLNHDILFDLAKGDLIERGKDVVDLPVLSGGVAYSALDGKVVARPISVQEEERIGRRGKAEKQLTAWRPPLWEFTPDPPIEKVHLAAGNRLYGGAPGIVMALEIPPEGGQPRVAWTERIEGEPWSMIASDGRLFVVTRDGGIHCFAGASISQVVRHDPPGSSNPDRSDSIGHARAAGILEETDQREGYALVFGLGDGSLAEELANQSNLHLIAFDSDPTKVSSFRERMAARDLYGRRTSAIARDPWEMLLPPYVANLIVVEGQDAATGGLSSDRIRTLFESLRPYGGTVCLPQSSAKAVQEAASEGAEVESKGDWILLRRPGPLPGSAPWTHQYADSSNSVVSRDTLVKAPLGVLWFGGPSHQGILPRHGHGPSEQVIGGRLFIEGPDMLRAVDVYTGRLLWEKSLPGVGAKYDETAHQPGANATGANYVSLEDGIYIIHGKECLRLDPASGEVLSRFVVPSEEDPSETEEWGFLNARDNVLLAATSPSAFDTDIEFHPDEFRKVSDEDRAKVTEWVERASGKPLESDDFEKVVDTLSDLLGDPHFSERLSLEGDSASKSETARARIADYLKA